MPVALCRGERSGRQSAHLPVIVGGERSVAATVGSVVLSASGGAGIQVAHAGAHELIATGGLGVR